MRIIMKKELRPCATHYLYSWNQAGSRCNYGNIMDVILLKDYDGLGQAGDLVDVNSGIFMIKY